MCCINEKDGLPEFSVTIIEDGHERVTFTNSSPTAIWTDLLQRIEKIRKEKDLVKLFPVYFSGEYMFGLLEPHVMRLIESLPGVEMLTNYAFKFGRLQLLEMPLTLNPTGCARSEPKLRTHFRKSNKLTAGAGPAATTASSSGPSTSSSTALSSAVNHRSASSASSTTSSNNGNNIVYFNDDSGSDQDDVIEEEFSQNSDLNAVIAYTKQFSLSKSAQIKKLKTEWKSNVYLAKSRIQGLGLFAARDLEKNTMIIEYIGDLIRNEVANRRERLYQSQNRGIYMFRLNDDLVVDATMTGGLARYVNHCCDPNCIAETVQNGKEENIVIIANKKILKGEEVSYILRNILFC